jgi:hypothetical protein
MKPELYVHLMELITESDRRAQEHPNEFMRITYARQADLFRKTLVHYEQIGEDPKLEEAISQLKMDSEEETR